MRIKDLSLAASSGLLLALPFNYSALFLLSWVGFVPLLLALRGKRPGQSYLLGLVCGLVLYGIGASWIIEFIRNLWSPGPALIAVLSLLFWLYCAQLPALLALIFQWLRRRCNWSDLLLFPLLVTLFFAHFPALFQARLGESQSAFLAAIQPVAFTGGYGLDAVLALVNILLYRWLAVVSFPWRDRAGLAAALLPLAWLGYGCLAVGNWDRDSNRWPLERVGFVQENSPPRESRESQPGYGDSYPRALELSTPLAEAGAQLVVWAETGFDTYFSKPRTAIALRRSAEELGGPLLLQGMAVEGRSQYNTSALVGPESGELGRYRKIRRVAFGEYLPLLEYFPHTGSRVREKLGGFFSRISAGETAARFFVGEMELLPLICYEALFPGLVADAARGGSGAELLVVQSNNSWFGSSRQPYQHLNASVLRAVENRRPLLHVINNGPSAVILPNGRRLLQSEFGEEAGYWVDVPLTRGLGDSFFTRHPRLFLGALYMLALAALLRICFPSVNLGPLVVPRIR